MKERSFYFDINKNIISYFNTENAFCYSFSNLFLKKLKHLSFFLHFGKRIGVKGWLGVGLGRVGG